MEAKPSSKSTADHCILHAWCNFNHCTDAGAGGAHYLVYGDLYCSKTLPFTENEAFIKKSSQFKHWRYLLDIVDTEVGALKSLQ